MALITHGEYVWPVGKWGLPTKQVELLVRGDGDRLGAFILTPTPALPPDRDCLKAVASVNQLGAALATHRNAA